MTLVSADNTLDFVYSNPAGEPASTLNNSTNNALAATGTNLIAIAVAAAAFIIFCMRPDCQSALRMSLTHTILVRNLK